MGNTHTHLCTHTASRPFLSSSFAPPNTLRCGPCMPTLALCIWTMGHYHPPPLRAHDSRRATTCPVPPLPTLVHTAATHPAGMNPEGADVAALQPSRQAPCGQSRPSVARHPAQARACAQACWCAVLGSALRSADPAPEGRAVKYMVLRLRGATCRACVQSTASFAMWCTTYTQSGSVSTCIAVWRTAYTQSGSVSTRAAM